MSADEFAKLTIAQLYDMAEQSGEEMLCLSLDGADGEPFAMFAVAIAKPEKLARYAKALTDLKPTVLDAVQGALNS